MRIAINGMGRIGRLLLKLLDDYPDINVVAVNDIMDTENLVYLLKYDSIYGTYNKELQLNGAELLFNKRRIQILNEADPSKLPWKDLGIDLVVEATGRFISKQKASIHLQAGAKKVLISTTGSDDVPLLIWGLNNSKIDFTEQDIVSSGGCMTNCTSHVLSPLIENFGIESVQINILHAYTSRQLLIDGAHKNFRRGRAAATAIIPVEIDLALTLEQLFPSLKDRIATTSTRIPIPSGTLADFSIVLNQNVKEKEVNALFKNLSENEQKGIVGYTEDLITSRDIVGNPNSCIVDGTLTKSVKNHLKLCAWFDNEYGYTSRLLDIANAIANRLYT